MKIKTLRKVEDETELDITGSTLLSAKEVIDLPNHLRTYTDSWWLRSPGNSFDYAAYIDCDGSVSYYGDNVGCSALIRPALQIENLKSSNLKIGDSIFFADKKFEIVSDTIAFCTTDIGDDFFREDYEAEDANDYEKSDVKKFVDEWFKEAKEKEATPETPSRECWGGCAYC